MFFRKDKDKIEQLNKLENKLGSNVFNIKQLINENNVIHQKVQSLIADVCTNFDLDKSDQIARILCVYSWALKIAGKKEDEVLKCLDIASRFVETAETMGLCTYVRASVLRGYSKFSESAVFAEKLLSEYFKEGTQLRAHALNCQALALMRQNKMDEAECSLNEALTINAVSSNSPVEKIIVTAEGSFQDRTTGNLAQLYEKTEQFGLALKLAKDSLDAKILAKRSEEEIAYAQIIVGEIFLKLGQSDKALSYFNSANAFYSDSSKMPVANHMRALVGLAAASQKQNGYQSCASALSLAKNIGEQLGLDEAHDFMKRIKIIEADALISPSITL